MDDKVKSGVTNATSGLTIGALAEATGASPRSLRHYEALGLIAADRDSSGYRRYGAGVADRVDRIRRLLRAGFNLSEITTLLPCMEEAADKIDICPQVAGLVNAKLRSLLTRSQELAEQRTQIRALIS